MDAKKITRGLIVTATAFAVGTLYGAYAAHRNNSVYLNILSAARAAGLSSVGADGRYLSLATKHEVPCPSDAIVILAMGQSNAANQLAQRHRGSPGVVNYFHGHCYAAQDPLLGATGAAGSLWTELGNQLAAKTGKPVVLVSYAVGGTKIFQWNHELRAGLVGTLDDLHSHYVPNFVLWQQGEADSRQTSAADYRGELSKLIAFVRTRLPSTPWLVAVSTFCDGADPSLEQAQRAMVDHRVIFPGPNTDEIASFETRSDDCHFSESGQQLAAQKWLEAIARLH